MGSAPGTGKGKGKMVTPSRGTTASEPETLSDSDDTGQPVRSKESPDPIDFLKDAGPSSDTTGHPFDAPSKRGPARRLANDGDSTLRLQARQKQRVEPDPADVVELSDDIESASDFDNEKKVQGRGTTPNGRTQIPQGAVKARIAKIESNTKRSTRGTLNMQPESSTSSTPFYDLHQKTGIKNGMKRKDGKVRC